MEIIITVISLVVGIPLGILASLAAWYILFHCVVPEIRFSPYISKINSDDGSNFKYRIKLENTGRRSIIDMELIAILRIKGISKIRPNNWILFYIQLDEPRILKLKPLREETPRKVINLYTENLGPCSISEYMNCVAYDKTLECLMSLGADSTLQLIAFGFDSFSGSRKLFESKKYTKEDIKFGKFKSDSFEIEYPATVMRN